ncbi:hypothetical protein FJT64_003896 [Amphibalanus amphitrite]|uniref:Uncharacterized protein n=1 Tax=Amphibalanus amphitrite TaxID=1232801 RepID=A0A6A4VRD7_AMPAM|nr:hypothetical protein FJT64_003896 [Amphibalanus amphitrite]
MYVTSRHSEYFDCEGAKSVFKEFLSDFVEESSDHGIRLFYMKVEESRWVQPTEGSDKSPIDGGCYAKSHYLR